jgi:hypothetical protein
VKKGEFTQLARVEINNEVYCQISNADKLQPFFVSIVSNSKHWLFIGSNGGLSAGRKDSENALSPYYTDDKIIESSEITGSKTILKIQKEGQFFIWEPFSVHFATHYRLKRNIFKSVLGNKILLEEENMYLNPSFQYQCSTSDQFGFVKTSKFFNRSDSKIELQFENLQPNWESQKVNSLPRKGLV